jgi:hypothetical protein
MFSASGHMICGPSTNLAAAKPNSAPPASVSRLSSVVKASAMVPAPPVTVKVKSIELPAVRALPPVVLSATS